jgi:hypothetical protein
MEFVVCFQLVKYAFWDLLAAIASGIWNYFGVSSVVCVLDVSDAIRVE